MGRACWWSCLVWFWIASTLITRLANATDESVDDARIYVVRRGWHIDIGVATEELEGPLKRIAGQLPGSKYLLFGFGDRRYLTANRQTASLMVGALWPGKGLLLITGLTQEPGRAFGSNAVRILHLSIQQSLGAQEFIWQSFEGARSRSITDIQSVARGPYEGSLYFNAQQRYSAVYTCNTWAADVMRHAGLPVHPTGVLFSSQVWRLSKGLAAAER